MLVKVLALFAFLFGCAYLAQGVPWLVGFASGGFRRNVLVMAFQSAVVVLDFLIGGVSIFIGIGLFFYKEWARKGWLALMATVFLIHLIVIALTLLFGYVVGIFYFTWTGMVGLIAMISWTYLTKAPTRVRFH